MTLISEAPAVRRPVTQKLRTGPGRARPSEQPILAVGDGAVVALRYRRVLEPGALGVRGELGGDRLVSARDLSNRPWWIPAAAIWSDADGGTPPEHPRYVGLATDDDYARAVLTGLSERLGWEALQAHHRGEELPVLDVGDPDSQVVVFDGRLGHQVPTVLVLGERFTRSGAGSTVQSAYRRAMFGDCGTADAARELADMALVLDSARIGVGVVDLGTALMRHAGISRVSVQLLAPSHDPVRPWDGASIQ